MKIVDVKYTDELKVNNFKGLVTNKIEGFGDHIINAEKQKFKY